ncbi:MAG: DUF4221 family protein [Roseivirga sp.]|nr:DUF4221 family protein [Roseivirga sp.]
MVKLSLSSRLTVAANFLKMKNSLIITFLAIVCLSCQENTGSQNTELNPLKVREFNLELDSVTGFVSPFLQYSLENKTPSLYTINTNSQHIYRYNLNNGKILERYPYFLEGPNGIGRRIDAFFVHSRDSIFVLDGWKGVISIIDHNGNVLNKFNMAPKGVNKGFPFPTGSSKTPLTIVDDKIVVASMIIKIPQIENIESPFIEYDMNTDSIEYRLQRPEINNLVHWGGTAMNLIYYDYDPEHNLYYISYSNYDKLIISDLKDVKIELPTPSRHFSELTPYSKDPNASPTKEEVFKYYATSPRYYGVYHDPYRNYIYRLAEYPNQATDYKPGVMDSKMSVIVIDKTSKKIVGEFDFNKEDYDFRMIFVSKEGLNLASKTDFSENEDVLSFHTFIIENEVP